MTLSRESLIAALAAANKVIPRNTPREILKQARLHERGGGVLLSATDLGRGVDVVVTGDAAPGEDAMLPVAEALAALATIDDDRVEVLLEKSGRTTLKSPTARWTWEAAPAADAPAGPDAGARPLLATLPGERLAEALDRVGYAVDVAETRYALRHAHLVLRGGECALTATDGKRLVRDRFPVEGAGECEVLVDPAAFLALLDALGRPASVAVHADATVAELRASDGSRGWALASSARFPPTDSVIPKCDREPARLAAPALLAAVRRANLATVKESRALRLTFEAGACLVSTANSVMSGDGGRVPFTGGAQPECWISGYFLVDALAGVGGELLLWTHETRPTVLKAASREMWTAIIMPVTIG